MSSIFSQIKDTVVDTTDSVKDIVGEAMNQAYNAVSQKDDLSKSVQDSVESVKEKEKDRSATKETFVVSSGGADNLYSLYVSKYIGAEYIPYVEDVMRMVTIQIVIQLMMFLQSPSTNKFFDVHFIEIVFYVVLGVTAYWLLVRKCVQVL
jgi:hypothetical protein